MVKNHTGKLIHCKSFYPVPVIKKAPMSGAFGLSQLAAYASCLRAGSFSLIRADLPERSRK